MASAIMHIAREVSLVIGVQLTLLVGFCACVPVLLRLHHFLNASCHLFDPPRPLPWSGCCCGCVDGSLSFFSCCHDLADYHRFQVQRTMGWVSVACLSFGTFSCVFLSGPRLRIWIQQKSGFWNETVTCVSSCDCFCDDTHPQILNAIESGIGSGVSVFWIFWNASWTCCDDGCKPPRVSAGIL